MPRRTRSRAAKVDAPSIDAALLDMPLRKQSAPYSLDYGEASAFLTLSNLERPLVWKLALPRLAISKEQAPAVAAGLNVQGDRFTKGFGEPHHVDAEPVAAAAPAEQVDRGVAEFGLQTPNEHEYFLSKGSVVGIVRIKQRDDGSWTATMAKSPVPRVLTKEAVAGKLMSPAGHSALPSSLEKVVPDAYQYWKSQDPEKARKSRDALVESGFFTDDCVKPVDGELRKVESAWFLYEAKKSEATDLAAPMSLGAKLMQVVPVQLQAQPNPFTADDWLEELDKSDGEGNLLIISPTSDSVSPRELARAVATLKGQWLIEISDSLPARAALQDSGPMFKIAGEPERLFVSSFAPGVAPFIETVLPFASASKLDARKRIAKKDVSYQGITVTIDRPKGFVQTGKDEEGNDWSRTYELDYGFIPRTAGGDGEALDVFLGDSVESGTAFWVTQKKRDGSFDEYKLFLGFERLADVLKAYASHIPRDLLVDVQETSVEQVKALLGLEPSMTLNKGLGMLRATPHWMRKDLGGASYQAVQRAANEAVKDLYPTTDEQAPGGCYPCPYVCDLFEDRLVYDYEGKLFQVPYTYANGVVTLNGEPVQVRQEYVPVSGAPAQEAAPTTPVDDSEKALKNVRKTALRIAKFDASEGEHYVLGIVLEPDIVDAQQDTYSIDEVRQAQQKFMEDHRNLGLMHKQLVNQKVNILENYIAPADFTIAGVDIKKGTWLMGVRVHDPSLWKSVREGALTGFSIGGSAVRKPTSERGLTPVAA